MKKIGLICILFTVLAASGVQAQGSDTGEIWRCFDPYDSGKNKVLVELTRARNLTSIEEVFEETKESLRAAGAEEFFEQLEGGIKMKKLPDTPENRRSDERILEFWNATRPRQVSVAGVSHEARFRIEGLNRRWNFGKEMSYSLIIKPDGSGLYYDFSRIGEGETTGPSQRFDCVSP